MSDVVASDSQGASGEGLQPLYKAYSRQKCFIGYSERAPWAEDLLAACEQVLREPAFDLEADYAREHLYSDTPLREKALELIANARYGIYDLSHWRDPNDPTGQWFLPRNVFIELGMAVALNRPVLLLRHAENVRAGLELPKCLHNLQIVEWAGDITLQATLRQVRPQWIRQDPADAWRQQHCNIGGRLCEHRESHPQVRQLVRGAAIRCHIADGQDIDQIDFREGIETEVNRHADMEFEHLDDLPQAEGYSFLLCSHCQSVRSNRFAIYRITPQTAAETYFAIGMTFGLEKQFGYRIPKMVFAETAKIVPSLLAGYEVVTAQNNRERIDKLRKFLPGVIKQILQLPWRRSPLPFLSTMNVAEESPIVPVERQEGEAALETAVEPAEQAATEPLVAALEASPDENQPQDVATRTCPSCGTSNRAEASFCANCGAGLAVSPSSGGPLASGTILQQRYQVVRLISDEGGWSRVYEVKDLADSPPTTWAVKELRLRSWADPQDRLETRIFFDQEADWFRTLSHRNILRFRDRFDEDGGAYLVLEYCDGQALDEVLHRRGGPITEQEVLTWAVQICDALEYLHTRNPPVIHRHVKPSVLMVAGDGTVKIVSFSIARTYKVGKVKDTVLIGTVGYASPEQHGKAQTDARSDIYALGATMYHLLTNQPPPMAVLPGDPPSVGVINVMVSGQISDIIAKAMQKDRSQRYQSAAEMRQAIWSAGQASVLPSEQSEGASPSSGLCPQCGYINLPGSEFCDYCGMHLTLTSPQPLVVSALGDVRCANCSAMNRPSSKFCRQCGTVLASSVVGRTPRDESKNAIVSEMLVPNSVLANRYVILGVLANGGAYTFCRAADSQIHGRQLAIKVYDIQHISDLAELTAAVEFETRMVSKLSHVGIPTLDDFFYVAGAPCQVWEWVEGESLDAKLSRTAGPLSSDSVIDWAIQLCDVVEYLHSQSPPIIHRDIKPSNILVDRTGNVKLMDFGIARFYIPTLTKDEVALGTPGYSPPEQWGKAQTDARSDIYALGATMHHLLSGRDPKTSTLFDFPKLSTLNPSVPAEISFIVEKALSSSRDMRFQSAKEMQETLHEVRDSR